MKHVLVRTAVVTIAVSGLSLGLATPVEAAVYTSDGVRCTKVGTSGANRLVGTSGRDVICGRGGNDLIRGLGGNDVLDGGPGNDRVEGGSGADVVLGGSGSDTLSGAAGTDRIYGGNGADRVFGGDQRDSVGGGDGNDSVSGGDGNDSVYGGADQDTLVGGPGSDSLGGGGGNDDLDGNSGADAIHGGTGTNWCTVDPADTSRARCVHDLRPPKVISQRMSRTSVDVTSSYQEIDVRARVTDDTGVHRVSFSGLDPETGATVRLSGGSSLLSGTVRDGWWFTTAVVRRWVAPAEKVTLTVSVQDRLGRTSERQFPDALTIVNRTPDMAKPSLDAFSVTSSTGSFPVDARTRARSVSVRAHLTDDASGAHALACLTYPSSTGQAQSGACPGLELYSGTARNGWFKATLPIPARAVGGDWNVQVWVTDFAHIGSYDMWLGPDVYREEQDWCGCSDPPVNQLPGGKGRFAVLGITDSVVPTLVSATVSSTTVDTLAGPATVRVGVRAQDFEGVTQVLVGPYSIDNPGGPPTFGLEELAAPTSGTRKDGWWYLDVTLPQGTPPGSYGFQVVVRDATHWRSSTTTAVATWPDQGELTSAQLGDWDGVVTVVPPPA